MHIRVEARRGLLLENRQFSGTNAANSGNSSSVDNSSGNSGGNMNLIIVCPVLPRLDGIRSRREGLTSSPGGKIGIHKCSSHFRCPHRRLLHPPAPTDTTERLSLRSHHLSEAEMGRLESFVHICTSPELRWGGRSTANNPDSPSHPRPKHHLHPQ